MCGCPVSDVRAVLSPCEIASWPGECFQVTTVHTAGEVIG